MDAKTYFSLFFAVFCLGSVTSSVKGDSTNPCKNSGKYFPSEMRCQCFEPFTGSTCEEVFDPCTPNPCKHNHTCEISGGHFRCKCREMYGGRYCEEVIDICYVDRCMNGGKCRVEGADFKCDCIGPYTGASCELETTTRPETASIYFNTTPAESESTTVDSNISTSEESSSISESTVVTRNEEDPCIPNPCENNHTCEHSEDSYTCNCRKMYGGKNCQTVLNRCYGDPCMNGGKCRLETEDFKCDCIGQYTGEICEHEITTRPETPNVSFTTSTTSSTSNEHNSSVFTNTIKPMSRNASISTILVTNATQSTNPPHFNATETFDKISMVSESSTITNTIYLTSSKEPSTTIAQPVTTVKLTTSADFELTTVDSNISIAEESSSISELIVVTSNGGKSPTTESASSKTTTVNSVSTADPGFVSSTTTDDPSTTVSESSSIIISTYLSSSEEESNITKVAQPATTVISTNLTELKLTTVNPNIPTSTSAGSSTISESTVITDNEDKSSTTESASSKTTTENSISTKTNYSSTMVSESSTITNFIYLTSSEEGSTTSKTAQPATTTVKLTNTTEFELTTVDPNTSISTLDEFSTMTKSTVLTSNEEESPFTKFVISSTIYLVSSTDSVSFEKSTKNILPRIVSSTTEKSNTITTESAISASTDDTVTKIELEAKKSSSKMVVTICGATGGGLGLILLITSVTYYLRRVKMRKQLCHFQRDDSSSVGSADSTSRLA